VFAEASENDSFISAAESAGGAQPRLVAGRWLLKTLETGPFYLHTRTQPRTF